MNLLLSEHLKESFHTTAYAINVYVLPGVNAVRLARYPREDIEAEKGTRILASFARKEPKKQSRKSITKQTADTVPAASRDEFFAGMNGKKRKRLNEAEQESELEDTFVNDDETMSLYADDDDPGQLTMPTHSKASKASKKNQARKQVLSDSEGEDGDVDWEFNLRSSGPATGNNHLNQVSTIATKQPRRNANRRVPFKGDSNFVNGRLIEILSDTD